MKYIYFFTICFIVISCKSTNTIVDRPITFDEERKILTLEYLSDRYGLQKDSPEIEPKMVVLHWTVIPTFEESFKAFNRSTLPNSRPDINTAGALNVSSQFMVDRDGTIYRLLPETTMARHVIGLNHCAIGVENVGGDEGQPLTKAQVKSNIWLVRYLANKYDIDYLIGHYEYTKFEDHPLWLEQDNGYRTQKTDPGTDFMNKVRNAVKDLNFKALPE
ncbi:peptidoglycan recognition family protein [Maribacter sp. PR1]|uniref:N-acetylmuramoyl-L-alanine amidase n=1 Tax=Maribacter cobaltidurans TaxID=1178778 RepID=A0ABU7ISF8_9FLAO|nr:MULTISPECIES: peptidoglycan recognition family protein [Maribacter]MDC6388520.1 peptidoglycan recognition family protein [Maribacter sp. PR1]MEE1975909.1 peptidoglycan recognition family protein [Maribacter cobaltidurans]